MIDLPALARRWRTTSKARRALTAALYGDSEPARRLVEAAAPHGAAHLAPIAAVWIDAYLTDTRRTDRVLSTPLDRWLGMLIQARALRADEVFRRVLGEVREPLVWLHLRALLEMAADARLALDDPDGVWP